MKRHLALFALCLLLLASTLPALADDDSQSDDAASAGTVAGGEAKAAEEEGGENAPNFRLFSRRDISWRLRPNTGMRVPPLAPLFSPRTADFEDRRPPGGPLYAVSASITALTIDGERDNFKGQEFRDYSENVSVGIDAQIRGDGQWLRVTGRHLLLDDRDVDLEWRKIGVLKARVHYNAIPHNFAFDARSLYSGIGTGRLTVDDSVQQSLQGSTSLIDAAERARAAVAGSPLVDVGLTRDRLGLELDLTAFDPLAVKITVNNESRDGARPWSGSFGLASFVEIPWAVDYDTERVKVDVEHAKGSTLVRGSYAHSSFENNVDTQVFDNPWRTTDSSLRGAINSTFQSGPATGLIDLYPSNEQDELTLTAVKSKLPGKGTLLATVAWNRMEQDDPLVPFTTNTAIVPGSFSGPPFDASDPANLPARSADAVFESQLIHLRWTSRPLDFLSVKAHFRDYDMDNESARITIPGFVLEDNSYRSFFPPGGGFTNLPIAQATTNYGVDLGFHLEHRTKLTLSYANEEIDREFREVENSSEDRFKLSIDAKPVPWVDLRASYLIYERTAENYDFDQFFTNQGITFISALPFLFKFDQASRDRDRLQLLASFFPTESLIVSGQVIVGSDEFPESRFGVIADDHEIYSLDVTYAASDRLSLFASQSVEEYDILLNARAWLPFGPGDPFNIETGLDSASNWNARSVDDIETFTLGLDVDFIADRLGLDVAYSWSESDGNIAFDSPIGDFDLNPFDPADFTEVDDVTFYNLNVELEYAFNDTARLAIAYFRDKYRIFDFNNEGFQLVPTNIAGEFNGGLLMGSLPGNFNIQALYLKLELAF